MLREMISSALRNWKAIAFSYQWNYRFAVLTTLSSKGQIVIPQAVRERKNLHPGDELEIKETAAGFEVRKKRRNEGLVDLLLACPVKGEGLPPKRRKEFPRRRVRF